MTNEYEDKYLLLRDENSALKKKKNEQESTIKRMYTKLAMIEEKLNKKRNNLDNQDEAENGENKAAGIPVKRDLDTEKFITSLKRENAALRKKNQSLVSKNRWLEEQCRQSSSLKSTTRPTTSTARVPMQKKSTLWNVADKRGGFAGTTVENQAESARKLHRDTFSGNLEVALKKRLVVAEKLLTKLQIENEKLRGSSTGLLLKPRQDSDEGPFNEKDGEDEMCGCRGYSSLDSNQMKRELSDRKAQLVILNARYENLESNALAEREIQEKTLCQMEQMNRQVHKLRTQLQDAIIEKEELEIQIAKTGDQEKDIALLREQNRRLEDRMTSLCESPFINDAFQRKERIDKLFDLEKLTREQKDTIAQITDENQRLQGVIRGLRDNIKQIRQAKDRVVDDLEQTAQHLQNERNARSLEIIKSTSNNAPVSRPELVLEKVMSPQPQNQPPEKRDGWSSPLNKSASPDRFNTVRQNGNLLPTSSFLDATGDENNIKHLRNRVHVLQIAHLKSMQELERCEKMLQAQTNINRELTVEIEELTTSRISSSNILQRQMNDLELLCEERQQKIQTLHAEIRQLKYAREKMLLKARESAETSSDECDSVGEESETASLSESLILAAKDLAPGEQLLELEIMSAMFDSNVVGVNSSTFVLCDFYDFESQSTPLVMGSRPDYNLAATFKVVVDGFFLRYLASECIVLEVRQAFRGDFKLVGTARIRLAKLLQSRGVIKEPLLAVRPFDCNVDSAATSMGTLSVVLRLSTPISEIWKLHLRSYPYDLQLLSSKQKRQTSVNISTDALCFEDNDDNASQLINELQITVFACRNLRSYRQQDNSSISRIPSSYAHYQLLGYPDVFTNIVPGSSNPEYDLCLSRQAFTLEVDACLLKFLSKCCLWITVFDDKAELADCGEEDGMVGKCGLILSDLVNGDSIRGWFPLQNQNNQHAGDISVLIQWKDPFQVLQLTSSQRARGIHGRLIDMHSLDFDQQHAVLTMFSSDTDGRVSYRQFLHYAHPSEELELLVSKFKERFEYAIDSNLVSSVRDALTTGEDLKWRKSMIVSVDAIVKAAEKYGIFLSDAERELMFSMFGTFNVNAESKIPLSDMARLSEKCIALNYLLLHIDPRLSCAERLLRHKIRQTVGRYVHDQQKRNSAERLPLSKVFEKFAETKCGKITRSSFRKCLSALGFDLMSVESEYRELLQQHDKQPALYDIPSKTNVKLSLQREIDLDEDALSDPNSTSKQQHLVSRTLETETMTTSPIGSHKASVSIIPDTAISPENSNKASISAAYSNSIPAATEFQRRKQAFMDRMKAIASSSSKNLVYEEVEKKIQSQRMQLPKMLETNLLSRKKVLQQGANQLCVSQNLHQENLHQDAAITLQRLYRQYKFQQQKNFHKATSILEADLKLRANLRNRNVSSLNDLKDIIFREIERDVPGASHTKFLSKKQFTYSFSKISSIALPPALLWQLMEYFSDKKRGMVAYRSLVHFITSTSTDEAEQEKRLRLSVLDHSIPIDHAYHIFVSMGDMNETGIVSIRKFRECLTIINAELSTKHLHLVTTLFDVNGFHILYHAFLHSISQLPRCQQLAKTLDQCHRFGVSLLREKLFAFVNSDDGLITVEQLSRVLMQQNTDKERFKPEHAALLFQMVSSADDTTNRISIQSLCLRLEAVGKNHLKKSLFDDYKKYDMHHFQRLAWNCRKIICGSLSNMKKEFERFDWQEKGVVSLVEFVSIARQNGFIVYTDTQLKRIAKNFSERTKGSFGINYRRFLDWTAPPSPVDMDLVEEKLRNFAITQADKLPSRQLSDVIANWYQILSKEADSSSEKNISRSQFVVICKSKLGLPLDETEVRALLYTYDPDLNDQVDWIAFLRLKWSEKAPTLKINTKVDSDATKVKKAIDKIEKRLGKSNDASKEIAEAFSYSGDTNDQLKSFLSMMRNFDNVLSDDELRALFMALGEQPEKQRMEFVKLLKQSFRLSSRSSEKCDNNFSPTDDKQLKSAIEAAVKSSSPKFGEGFVQFEEFCILKHFAPAAPTTFWYQMEVNGLAKLLSKRCVGLLMQKFSTGSNAEDSLDLSVSLEAVHSYLKDFLTDSSIKAVSKASTMPIEPTAATTRLKPVKNPIKILSAFLDWCDERGLDLRGELEARDSGYAGFVTAMELKQALLHLGIAAVASPLSAEAVTGQLVRQFRSKDMTDAVYYTEMLFEATKSAWIESTSQWYYQITEDLRSRIRSKGNFAGRIDHSDQMNYSKLDAAFSHFDRENKGFLTKESFYYGLRALNYELTPEQVGALMLRMCIFRHNGGGLSRAEFDSFVLDPYGIRLLRRLSDQLYSDAKDEIETTLPRVAYLSQLLLECVGGSNKNHLPKATFYTQLERALERQVTKLEELRLQHLFDVSRDGHIAFKLFLKVISQWRAPVNTDGIPFKDTKEVHLRQATDTNQRDEIKLKQQSPTRRITTNYGKPVCSCDTILHSLYNQMSSIDFSSQAGIVVEYLRLKDCKHTGNITLKLLKNVFDQIGLSLSADAFTCLQAYFPGDALYHDIEEQGELVAYEKLLAQLSYIHEQSRDNK